MSGLVILNADLDGGPLRELRIEATTGGSRIVELGTRVDRSDAEVIDAAGRAVMPGFTDHHLHLHALAVSESSVQCGPPQVTDADDLRAALRSAGTGESGWVRGVGYVESVAGDLDRHKIDDIDSRRPVRIQHRSGAMWMLNSMAIDEVRASDAHAPGIERDASRIPTGRIWRADDWLRTRLPATGPPSLSCVGSHLRQLGIVEVTDATPDLDDVAIAHIIEASDRGELSGRVHLLGVPLGMRINHPRVSVGPHKIVVADSSLPELDDLVNLIRAAHHHDRAVAVHCVSGIAFALLMAAWTETGVRQGDRIEHAGVVPHTSCAELGSLGVHVITQPGFLPDRGDYFLAHSDPREHDDLYRCGSFISEGVPVALSSDAPFGPLNPWATIDAAVRRRTRSGRRVGSPDEAISVADALQRHQTPASSPEGPPRTVTVHSPANLLIADRPFAEVLANPGTTNTSLTVVDGRPHTPL